jgi:hypothetical protein
VTEEYTNNKTFNNEKPNILAEATEDIDDTRNKIYIKIIKK